IDSSIIGLAGSHNVSPVVVSFNPTAAAISPAYTLVISSLVLAFKIMTDPFVGKLAFFRVYSGTLESGSYVLNATKNKRERIG
ncbi:hypothetical protein EWM06_20475, partial [Clostridioides difficile]